MNDPVVKVAAIVSVVLGTFFCFGAVRVVWNSSPAVAPSRPASGAPDLSIRRCEKVVVSPSATAAQQPIPASPVTNVAEGAPEASPTVVTPWKAPQPIPYLAKKYPGDESNSGWMSTSAVVAADKVAPIEPSAPKRHTIVDGDTLQSLAERYLGSAARSQELFEANRTVLSNPKLLPIGVELKIPARDASQSAPKL